MAGALLAGCSDEETTNTSSTASSSAATTGGGGNGSGGSGASSTGGSGVGGQGGGTIGASPACQTCVADLYTSDPMCAANIPICDNDPACNDWKNCNEACFNEDDTVACYDACDQAFPHDEQLSAPLLACTCDACGTLCVASCS